MSLNFYKGLPVGAALNTITKQNKDDNYHISYLSSVRDYGVETTALVIVIDGKRELYYILEGNHSKGYGQCNNLAECIKYYKDNIALKHKYSDKLEH